MLQGMKILKLYGWERIFVNIIKAIRRQELGRLRWMYFFIAANCEQITLRKHTHNLTNKQTNTHTHTHTHTDTHNPSHMYSCGVPLVLFGCPLPSSQGQFCTDKSDRIVGNYFVACSQTQPNPLHTHKYTYIILYVAIVNYVKLER